MAYLFELQDEAGTVVGTFWLGHLDRSYILTSGEKIPVYDQLAWCRGCHDFVAAECLPTLSKIDEEFAKHCKEYGWFLEAKATQKDMDDWFIRHTEERHVRHQMQHREQREWRQRRRSPERCLTCGSTSISPIPMNAERIVHPVSNVILACIAVAHASLASHDFYSEEGERLPDEMAADKPESR